MAIKAILRLICLWIWFSFALAACSGTADQLKRGDELVKAGLYEEALDEYSRAADTDPDDPSIQTRIGKVKMNLAEAANSEGLAKLEAGDAQAALLIFKRAISLQPGAQGYKVNLKKAALHRISDGNKAIEKKKFAEAITIFESLIAELPHLRQAKQGLKDAQLASAEVLLAKAVDYQERGLHGSALISLVKLRKAAGTYGDSADRELASRAHLADAAQFGVRVKSAKVKRRLMAGTAKLVQRLQRAEVSSCSVAGNSESPRVHVAVALLGIDYDTDRSMTTARQKYQSGTRPVDNPKYLELEKKIENTRKRVAELEALIVKDKKVVDQMREVFADAGPDDDDQALRSRLKGAEKTQRDHEAEFAAKQKLAGQLRNELSNTPQKLDEPVYDEREYDIVQVVRTARVRMQIDARSEGGQKLIRGEPLDGKAETKDQTYKAQARFGIKGDPLSFPKSDEDLVDVATDAVVSKAAERVAGLCKRWQGEVIERARQARSAAELEAIEDYVLYLFVSPAEPPQDLVHFLKQKRDFEDVGALVGKPRSTTP